MNPDERNALVATVGLALTGLGAFLPWARIGGRNRSGFNTADTFLSLARGPLPDIVSWVGRWWYLPAFLAFLAWASTFFRGRLAVRIVGVGCALIGAIMWWLFVWAGQRYNVLNTQLMGPIVASLGLATLVYACSRVRGSVVSDQT